MNAGVMNAGVMNGGNGTLELTDRQGEILEFIKRYLAQNGYPPTVRDIGQAVGLTSSSLSLIHI